MSGLRRVLPRHPRSLRGWLIAAAVLTVVVALGGFAFVYVVAFGTSSPPPLSLSSPPAVASGSAAPPALTGSRLAGTWKVGTGSVAGSAGSPSTG